MDPQSQLPEVAQNQQPEKKKASKLFIVLSIILIVLVAFVGGAAAGYLYYQAFVEEENMNQVEKEFVDYITSDSSTTISTETKSDGSFWIHEEYVGTWDDVKEVTSRPEITASGAFDCTWEHLDDYSKCELENSNYVLIQENDNYKVNEGEAVLWERDIVSGPCNGVTGFKALGDEFIVDYLMLEPALDSVVASDNESLMDVLDAKEYDRAFAPFSVMGKLVYIAEKDGKMFTVYDELELGEKYDEIYFACCCEGMKYSVRGDGNIIDFFAKKSDGEWYHVRAGEKEYVEL